MRRRGDGGSSADQLAESPRVSGAGQIVEHHVRRAHVDQAGELCRFSIRVHVACASDAVQPVVRQRRQAGAQERIRGVGQVQLRAQAPNDLVCPGDPVLVRRCGVGSVRRGSIIVVAGVSEGVDVNGVVFRERETFTEWLPQRR